jgi:hypothetical protein
MKFSIAAAALILVITFAIGSQGQQRLSLIREKHTKLITHASRAGIMFDATSLQNPIRITKRERNRYAVKLKLIVEEFIAYSQEMEALAKEGGGEFTSAMRKRYLETTNRMASLNASQTKDLISEAHAAKNLDEKTRRGLIYFALNGLASEKPRAALELLTESSGFLKKNDASGRIVSSALAKWAKDDPRGALEWVKQNREKFPDLITDETNKDLIRGAASQNPKLAFQFLSELGIKNPKDEIRSMVSDVQTNEHRTATLHTLRDYLANMPDEIARAELARHTIICFARGLAAEGFEKGSQWMSSAQLTPDELKSITSHMVYQIEVEQSGKWV